MKKYVIRKVDGNGIDWDKLEKAEIDTYSWMDNAYRPRVCAALCYDAKAIYIRFWSFEKEIRGTHKIHNEMVCEDSCVEFFMRPKSSKYFFNFETNVLGTMLLGFGEERENRESVAVDDAFEIVSSVKNAETYQDEMWTISYQIPFAFLKKYYGDLDIVQDGLRANLCKCGDLTKYEHYGMWNPILVDEPDFHVPAYFGEMVFEV
ncbi:MAG: carbohydrate-binding family 9-like protein [Clostridia bacterium]|nr:carbohydrate-binding family 9-like protein [Clostridia bacterium]